MAWRTVLAVLSYLLLILALCLLAPLVVAIIYDSNSPYETSEIVAFAVVAAFALVTGLTLRHKYSSYMSKKLGRREGFAIVSAAWLAAVVLGMLPYLFSGVTESLTDAFFETMSGFTTTGASIFGNPGNEIEKIPHGLQFWRCMTQWLGGMGIVVLSVALLSFLGVGGYRLVKAETPGGVAFERERPRIKDVASDMWKLYLGISAAEVVLLIISGTTVYDAFCHTFTTMSTGGFSPHGESVAFFGASTQWIIIVFMFMAGVNFSLYAHLFRLNPRPMINNPEFRTYTGIILVVVVIGLLAVPFNSGLEKHVRDVVFQAISIGTTTGYATADFDAWPQIMRLMLVLLMFVGGCMGSTGGGMKVARFIIYFKAIMRELHHLVFPHAVRPIRVGEKVIDPKIVANIMAFGAVFAALFVVGTLTMAACGYDLITASSASVAAIGNIGPGLGEVGPMANWAHLPDIAKWIMSVLMLLGRLELFSVLILFTAWAWKK
jgi:trk/ktr system potassium uptake protein